MNRRHLLALLASLPASQAFASQTQAQKLVAAAKSQIGQTVIYDPAYITLSYPNGDVPLDRGVCTDVIIRAYRKGLGLDLQKQIHESMKANFSAYPKTWGLKKTDRNIDHRRVPNLQKFFALQKAKLPFTDTNDFKAGDLVTMMLPGNLPHIGIVSDNLNEEKSNLKIIHNISSGTKSEDILGQYKITGRYRYLPSPT